MKDKKAQPSCLSVISLAGVLYQVQIDLEVYFDRSDQSMFFEIDEQPNSMALELYNTQAQMKWKTVTHGSNKIRLQSDELSPGLYFFRVYTDQGGLASGKLLVSSSI